MTFTKPISKQKSVCDFFVGKLSTHKIKNSNCTYSDYCYNIPLSFDIETSSWESNNEKYACMYVWQFGINGQCIFGRTWDEFLELCDVLTMYTTCQCQPSISDIINGTGDRLRFIVYVHNLGYEFQFFRKYFNWNTVFTDTTRKPIYALTENGLEFRDSLRLTGLSLEKSCENLTRYHVKKMVGDLDYKLLRGPRTPLTEKELGYIRHDVTSLNAIIKEKMEFEGNDLSQVPYTNTGYVRRETRNKCYNRKYKNEYVKLMNELIIPDLECYNILKEGFAGGFTHASYLWVGRDIKGKIDSFDFTSSYPAVMVTKKFPCEKFSLEIPRTWKKYYKSEKYCFIGKFAFYDIQYNKKLMPYIKSSKCMLLKKCRYDNGRVWKAKYLEIYLTDIDLELILKTYSFKYMICIDLMIAQKDFLTDTEREFILKNYEFKTTLKNVAGEEENYKRSKNNNNSEFGRNVQHIIENDIEYIDGEWQQKEPTEQEIMDKLKKMRGKKQYTMYARGIFITAYARCELYKGIECFGKNIVYVDTDSCKGILNEEIKQKFDTLNEKIIAELKQVLPDKLLKMAMPSDRKGNLQIIGTWDWETEKHKYDRFKTFGSKKYVVESDNKTECTISGLSKQAGKYYKFDDISMNTLFTSDKSGRTVAKYQTEQPVANIGGYISKQKISLSIIPSTYKLGMTDDYIFQIISVKENEKNEKIL